MSFDMAWREVAKEGLSKTPNPLGRGKEFISSTERTDCTTEKKRGKNQRLRKATKPRFADSEIEPVLKLPSFDNG